MPILAKYLLIASMDVESEKEKLFNEVYDNEHVPRLLEVPGVGSVTRLSMEPLIMSIGGKRHAFQANGPAYTAVYEIDSPDVLTSEQWAAAVELGRWPDQVRPFTKNRQHALWKVIK